MKIDRTNKYYDTAIPEDAMWFDMWLFDGETFSQEIYTPKGYDIEAHWQEVTGEFKEEWERSHPQR